MNSDPANKTRFISFADSVSWKVLAGKTLILYAPQDNNVLFYELNEAGTAVWKIIGQLGETDKIIKAVKNNFGEKTPKKEILNFINSLERRKLIQFSSKKTRCKKEMHI